MANIPDQPPSWAAIPLIEETDPVLGGPGGAANQQAISIAKRLQWARNALETVIGTVAGLAQQLGVTTQSLDAVTLQATQARAIGDDALARASTARSLADAATSAADGALSTAQAATQTATSALTDATAARTTAESANTTAATAASNASTAKTTAESANTTAASAKTTADAARTTADSASTMASSADSKATAASTKADTATTTANNAATAAGTATTTANTARTIAEARAIRFDLPNATVTYAAALAVGAGARSLEANCVGARVGDAIFVSPTAAIPDGYGVGAAQCLAADKIRVSVIHPALALGANFSIPMRVFALRTGTT